ncbi:MAG: hypothetical protein HY531_01215 [Chloroflexi bacterium]|nr:hypothetical protein [Chloroflexota bacterium]
MVQVIDFKPEESVNAILAVPTIREEKDLLLATRKGEIKRMSLGALANIHANGLNAMNLEPGDELVSVRVATGQDELIMVSKNGFSIRFPVAQLRSRSRAAGGVRGMKLREGDTVVAMEMLVPEEHLLVISERGYGKPTPLDRYRKQNRGGNGLSTFRITPKSGPVATARVVSEGEDILILSKRGQETRTSLSELRLLSRRTQGVSIVALPEGDEVVSIAPMEPRIRTARDTTPRQAQGNSSARLEVSSETLSTNGHKTEDEEEQP